MSRYQALYTVAIMVGLAWAGLRLYRAGFDTKHIIRGLGISCWGGVGGAYVLHYVVTLIPHALPWSSKPYWGGNSIMGVILGGAITGFWYLKQAGLPWRKAFDAAVLPLPLAQAIGRMGCLSAGCCYGKPSTSWMAMRLRDTQGVTMLRYPTQLIASFADLLIFGLLLLIEFSGRRRKSPSWAFQGFLSAGYLALYSIKRFLMEFIRQTANPIVGPLTWAQLLCLVGLLLSGTAIFRGLRRRQSTAER